MIGVGSRSITCCNSCQLHISASVESTKMMAVTRNVHVSNGVLFTKLSVPPTGLEASRE